MLKKIFRAALVCTSVGALFFIFPPHSLSASAENTNFQVNFQEILSVSVTTPSTWAEGEVGEFLRNKVTVGVTSNNASGFTAGMTTSGTSTALSHSSKNNTTIPTIGSGNSYTCAGSSDLNCSAFVANHWGYSITDGERNGTYLPMVNSTAAPITILSNSSAASGSQDVYFGSKADISQASGTYSGTVVISVVSGTSGSPLPAPSGSDPTPVGPSTERTAEYNSTANATVYTYTTTRGSGATATTETTTQVTPGDNTSAYEGYTPPQGATEVSSSNIYEGSMLTTALAATASVVAGTGIVFFILAKRKKDDDEDEEETI